MRRSLERSDTIINLRNQEIATLLSRLAAKDETIALAAEQFDRLDSEVTQLRSQLATERASREELQKDFDELNKQYLNRVFVAEALQNEKSATASELPEPADLLNQLKGRRKKSKADLADVKVMLEILGGDDEN